MRLDDTLHKIPPKGIKAQRDFLLGVLEENQEDFRRLFAEMAIENPLAFVKMYRDISAMLVPKQNELNVNLTLNQDFQELQALGSSGVKAIGGRQALEGGNGRDGDVMMEAVDYEEMDEG